MVKKFKISILALLCILIAGSIYVFVFNPLKVTNTYVTIEQMGQELMDYYIDTGKYVDNGMDFETNNANDFYIVNIRYEFQNFGFFKLNVSRFNIINSDELTFVSFQHDLFRTRYFSSFETYLEDDSVRLTLYCPNKTEKEVLEMIKDIEFEIEYNTKLLNSLSTTTKLNEFEVVDDLQLLIQEYEEIDVD